MKNRARERERKRKREKGAQIKWYSSSRFSWRSQNSDHRVAATSLKLPFNCDTSNGLLTQRRLSATRNFAALPWYVGAKCSRFNQCPFGPGLSLFLSFHFYSRSFSSVDLSSRKHKLLPVRVFHAQGQLHTLAATDRDANHSIIALPEALGSELCSNRRAAAVHRQGLTRKYRMSL